MYPTKEAILAEPRPLFHNGVLLAISIWKAKHYAGWAKKDPGEQWGALVSLANRICTAYGTGPVTLDEWSTISYYDSVQRRIGVEGNSIISLFHELAHHLFGPDELTACRWSVWLYQLRFRNDYNKLVWNGHLLVKKSKSSASAKGNTAKR